MNFYISYTDQNNFIFKDEYNVETFAKYLLDGTEAWGPKYIKENLEA